MKSQVSNINCQLSIILFLIIFHTILFSPLISLAQGLVPCGGEGQPACDICHLFLLLKAVVDFVLTYIVFPLAVLLLVIGGGMFFLYAENPKRVDQATALLTSVIIGLVIIFAAWLIINTFFMAIGVADWTGLREGWFQIDCEMAPSIGGLCDATPTTNWGEGPPGCNGYNQRCYDGVCRTCIGDNKFFYSDGCGGCAGQGGMACWRNTGFSASCNNFCKSYGTCVQANWDDSTNCDICRGLWSKFYSCSVGNAAWSPIRTLGGGCHYRDSWGWDQDCSGSVFMYRRMCVCQF